MAPAIRTYDKLCNGVYAEFKKLFKNSRVEFATILQIKDILTDGRLAELYNSLVSKKPAFLNRHKDERFKLPPTAEQFQDLIKNKMLYEFLAVLLFAKCKKSTAKVFVAEMLVAGQANDQLRRHENPNHLPQEEEDLVKLFDDREDAQRFYNRQHHFCVIVIGSSEIITIKPDNRRTLPWVGDGHLGSGSFGDVEKVVIPPHHFTTDGHFNDFNAEKVAFARKSFKGAVNPGKSFNQEVQNIRKILGSYSRNKNILMSVAAVIEETCPPNFYLLMPLAEMDLQCYLSQDREMDMSLKTSLLNSAAGLADGVAFLHNGIRDSEEDYICYHLDLKPANILIFKESSSSSTAYDTMTWKLSDFGISKVKIVNKSLQRKKYTFLADLFQTQKQQVGEVGASDTKNLRGISTFLPPEASSRTAEMNDKTDIWSLGCIISILFTYMAYGSEGVKSYAKARGRQHRSCMEVFWESGPFYASAINREVPLLHQKLIVEARDRNEFEGGALEEILAFLEGRVLKVIKGKRCDAMEVFKQLKKTRKHYAEGTRPTTPVESNWWARKSSDLLRRPSGSSNVKRWKLASTISSEFSGCDTSPDGSFMVFWNARTIELFDQEATLYDAGVQNDPNDQPNRGSLDFLRRPSTNISAEATLKSLDERKPDDARENWTAVELTNNHLIAMSTTEEASYCYVFLIKGESEMNTYCRKELLDETVHLLSACLDQETLICLLRNRNGQTTLWRAKIDWYQPPPVTEASSMTDTTSSSSDDQARPTLLDVKTFPLSPLNWSAQEITHIILQSHNLCYMVVREQGKPHEVVATLYNLRASCIASQQVNLRRHEDTTPHLFSDITHSSGRPEAIMVTHSDAIWHFKSQNDGKSWNADHHQPVTQYRILRVARCIVTGRIFALGSYTGNDYIVLLEIVLGSIGVVPAVTKIAKLNGLPKASKRLHLRISHYQGDRRQEGKFAILVIAPRPPREYCVYRVEV